MDRDTVLIHSSYGFFIVEITNLKPYMLEFCILWLTFFFYNRKKGNIPG